MPKKISAETRANASPLAVADAIAVNKTEKLKLWQKSQKSKNWNLILSHIEHFRITPKFPAKSLTAWNQEWTWQYQRMVTGQRWQKSAWVNVGAKKTIEFKLKLQYHLKVTVRILKIQICVRNVRIEIPILAAFEYSQLKHFIIFPGANDLSCHKLNMLFKFLAKKNKQENLNFDFELIIETFKKEPSVSQFFEAASANLQFKENRDQWIRQFEGPRKLSKIR